MKRKRENSESDRNVKPKTTKEPPTLTSITKYLIYEILGFLNPREHAAAHATCKLLQSLAYNESAWPRNLIIDTRAFRFDSLFNPWVLWKLNCRKHVTGLRHNCLSASIRQVMDFANIFGAQLKSLSFTKSDPGTPLHVEKMPNLTTLSVRGFLSAVDTNNIVQLKHLTALSLQAPHVPVYILTAGRLVNTLQSLYLKITGRLLSSRWREFPYGVPPLPSLTELSVTVAHYDAADTVSIMDRPAFSAQNFPSLKVLRLNYGGVPDTNVPSDFWLVDKPLAVRLTSVSIEILHCLSQLHDILSWDVLMDKIDNMPALNTLWLEGCKPPSKPLRSPALETAVIHGHRSWSGALHDVCVCTPRSRFFPTRSPVLFERLADMDCLECSKPVGGTALQDVCPGCMCDNCEHLSSVCTCKCWVCGVPWSDKHWDQCRVCNLIPTGELF
jgi:hypothetical protein